MFFYSCSTDYSVVNLHAENNQALNNLIRLSYNPVEPNLVTDSLNYSISDNKFVNAIGLNGDGESRSVSYNYTNERLSQIQVFKDGSLSESESFIYDENGELIEYNLTSDVLTP